MSFSEADYQVAAADTGAPVPHIKGVSQVESAGETSWIINGVSLPPVREEAHWFGKLSGYRFNGSHPDVSSTDWNPALAANTHAGAWAQVREAEALDKAAADQATSWGAFQVMGFNWQRLRYNSIDGFVLAMQTASGQMDAFVRYIKADAALQNALVVGEWDTFEQRYNGGGFHGAYAARIRDAVALFDGSPALPRAMRQGDKGDDVRALQRALGIIVDGDFGPATEQEVRLFQMNHDLVADGIAGFRTMNTLAQRGVCK
jgi:murein L,D-transpeptidase YcbB/YkuD